MNSLINEGISQGISTTGLPMVLKFIIGISVIILLFIIFREIVTWYWKINEIVNLLKEIRNNTKKEQKAEENNQPQ